ncbi:CHAD domain-containing protein [Methanofollis fontis]|uniref:CHAD domain-containing protein n=1 Tax=Methanofollis fontis TaxID=2052832 RepID=A0A483CVG9_9EURY|nr:CHAD domain-containing protein [Methanofollis fontis]TAJ45501.1 hypothetical protein CUJ86_01875 [Methanofollis fontis]
MAARTPETADAGYCLFGAGILKKQAENMAVEIEGVRAAEDIEYIHRMRVASRRLRAAMPLFSECFGAPVYKRWRRQIKGVTRSLGEARDADVQIDFLRSYIADLPGDPAPPAARPLFSIEGGTPEPAPAPEQLRPRGRIARLFDRVLGRPASPASPEAPLPVPADPAPGTAPLRPGLECLLLRLAQHRQAIQPDVAAAMDALEGSGVAAEIADVCREVEVRGRMAATDVHSRYAFEQGYIHISLRQDELFSHEGCVSDPDAILEHHAMRIAAKRLRYTMEIFGPLYPDGLKDAIKSVKRMQDYLGDIHDCDVWADYVLRFLEEERERCVAYFGHDGMMRLVEPGVLHLREERMKRRRELFDEFSAYWQELRGSGYREGLDEALDAALRQAATEALPVPEGGGGVTIALIGDVHANLPALQAVLEDARSRGAVAVLDAGDAVGYGPFPEASVGALRQNAVRSVAGNYDLQVLAGKGKKKRLPKDRQKRVAMQWAYDNISKESRLYLGSLPAQRRFSVGERRILLCHGSPESPDEYLDAETPVFRLQEIAALADADIVVSGHAHRPSVREVGGVWFVNTGSVGRQDDGDPRACYALLQTDPFSICHLRIPYNVDRTVAAVFEAGLPTGFARMFREGRSLDSVRLGGEGTAEPAPEGLSVTCSVGDHSGGD